MTREDAKVFMRKEWRECMKGSFAESAFEIAIEALEQPERKKGKWIYLDKDKRFFHPHIVKCSVCDNTLDMYGVNAGRGDANFCPNCGADMREDGEADDPV